MVVHVAADQLPTEPSKQADQSPAERSGRSERSEPAERSEDVPAGTFHGPGVGAPTSTEAASRRRRGEKAEAEAEDAGTEESAVDVPAGMSGRTGDHAPTSTGSSKSPDGVEAKAEAKAGSEADDAETEETAVDVPAGTPGAVDATCHIQGLGGIEAETARRLACDADVLGAVVDADGHVLALGRTRRLVSRAQRRALMIRDGMCQFAGCHQTRHLKAHHRVSWADGGPTDLTNLILLCQWHHTAVHEGRIRIVPAAEPCPGRRWDFVMPDGRSPNGWPSHERLTSRLAALVGRRRYQYEFDAEYDTDVEGVEDVDRFNHPDAQRIVPGWRGERFNLSDCVSALFGMQLPDERQPEEEWEAA